MADGSLPGTYGFGPIGPRASTTRPQGVGADPYGQQTWFRDASGPGKADGTVIPADFLNKIIGTYIGLAKESGANLGGNQNNDFFLADAVRRLIGKTRFTVGQIEDLEDRLASFAMNEALHVTRTSFEEEIATRESADIYLSARIDALEGAGSDADTLNGEPGSYYLDAANLTGTLSPSRIAAGALANAKLADMAASRIKGRISAGSGAPEDLTAADVKTILAIAAGDVSGLGALATASSVTASQINDASANGRTLITAADYAAMKSLLAIAAADVSGLGGLATLSAITASLISDASANGRSLIQAANFAAMRASGVLNIEGITPRGDATYTILATDRLVATNAALTASRAWTLPAANAVNPGQPIIVADLAGGVTGTNTIVITRAGSDTINGGNTVTLSSAFGLFLLWSDGASKWIAQGIGASSAAGVSSFNTRTGAVSLTAADVAPFLGFGAGVA